MALDNTTINEAVIDVLKSRMDALEKGELTKKDVRRAVEEKLGMEKKTLDPKKQWISECISNFIEEQQKEEEDDEEEPPKKKTRKRKRKNEEEEQPPVKKVVKCRIKVAEGMEAPKKGIKDAQRDIMTGADFLENATSFKLSVFGNEVESMPRSFSSGNRGWWGGGKVWIPVGKQKLWAQLGINLTIIGSKEWEED